MSPTIQWYCENIVCTKSYMETYSILIILKTFNYQIATKRANLLINVLKLFIRNIASCTLVLVSSHEEITYIANLYLLTCRARQCKKQFNGWYV